MYARRRPRRRIRRRGASYVLALIMTAVLSTMAMAMVKSTGTEMHKAVNQREAVKARLAAESGVAFISEKLSEFKINGSPAPEEVISALGVFLNNELPGGTVSYGGGQIQISGLNIDASCGTFSGALSLNAQNDIELDVEGQSSQARRNIGLQYELIPGGKAIFEKGIVAGGPICMTGNAHVQGANSADEAQLLSLTDETLVYDLISPATPSSAALRAANPKPRSTSTSVWKRRKSPGLIRRCSSPSPRPS